MVAAVIVVQAGLGVATLMLGVPVWLALGPVPNWRWLLERDDSPWYPGARLFRQPLLGDWDSTIDRVRTALQALAAEHRLRAATRPGSLAGLTGFGQT